MQQKLVNPESYMEIMASLVGDDKSGEVKVDDAAPPAVFETVVEEVGYYAKQLKNLDNGDLPTEQLLLWADRVPKIYEAIFSSSTVVNQLKGDLNNSIKTVRLVYAQNTTGNAGIQTMITNEIQNKTLQKVRKDTKTATIGLLWMKRAMQFMLEFLKNIVANVDKPTKQCAQETYAAVLKPYHGWLTSKAVGLTMGWTPAKADLIQKFGYTDETFQIKMSEFLAVFEPIIMTIHNFLDGIGANFADKV